MTIFSDRNAANTHFEYSIRNRIWKKDRATILNVLVLPSLLGCPFCVYEAVLLEDRQRHICAHLPLVRIQRRKFDHGDADAGGDAQEASGGATACGTGAEAREGQRQRTRTKRKEAAKAKRTRHRL